MGDEDPYATQVRLFRITVLGASRCGKTSLVTSFVNSIFATRHTPTESATVFYKAIDVFDEDEGAGQMKRMLLEIEDTPGSDQGAYGASDKDAGKPTISIGSRVRVLSDRKAVLAAFDACLARGVHVEYTRGMDALLGQEFIVKSQGEVCRIAALAAGGAVWEFPREALQKEFGVRLLVDSFLGHGEKPAPTFAKLSDRAAFRSDLQRPFAAFERPVGVPTHDRTVTKRRHAFLVCFDVSDDGTSLKEAVQVFNRLSDRLETGRQKLQNLNAMPIVWLVGCQADRTADHDGVQKMLRAARGVQAAKNLTLRITSARTHEGTRDLFHELARSIEGQPDLWRFNERNDDAADGEDQNCALQ